MSGTPKPTPARKRSRKSEPAKRKSSRLNDASGSSSSSSSPEQEMSWVIFHGRNAFRVSEEFVKEMRQLQKATKTMIPKASFMRVIKEILQQYGEFRVQCSTLAALQEAAELYMTSLFEDSLKLAYHSNRVTLKPRDIKLVLELRNDREAAKYVTYS